MSRTNNVPQGGPAYIDDSDLTGFQDLIHSVEGSAADVLIASNGGLSDAAKRIVRLLRNSLGR